MKIVQQLLGCEFENVIRFTFWHKKIYFETEMSLDFLAIAQKCEYDLGM